jgi:hypothetical protein
MFSETTEPPEIEYPITSDMIEAASNALLINHDVLQADIFPQDDTLGIAIIIAPGTDENRAQELAKLYLETLAGAASATYSELSGPTSSSLGEIFDYYDLVISIGTGPSEEELIARGTKNAAQSDIYWRADE